MEGARFDEGEVGHQGAHAGDVLDAPHQVDVGRVVLVDHRRPVQVGIVHQQVDLIAGEGRRVGIRGLAFLAVALAKELSVVDYVAAHRPQVVQHRRQVGVVRLQLLYQCPDRVLSDLPVQFLEAAVHLALPEGDLTEGLLQVLAQLVDELPEMLLFLFRELSELLRVKDMAIPDRGQGVASGRVDEGDAAFLGLAADGPGGLFLTLLELLLQSPPPGGCIPRSGRRRGRR